MSHSEAPHVLVGLDGSDTAHRAAIWAAAEAARRHLELRLVTAYVAPADVHPGVGVVMPDLVTMARAWASNVLHDCVRDLHRSHPDLAIRTSAPYGHAATALVEESRHAELTVVGSHGRHQLFATVLGSVAARVVTHAESPVVVVRTGPGTDAAPADGRVVVGVDDSPHARAAIGFAFESAATRKVGLRAVHVWNEQAVLRAMAGFPMNGYPTPIDLHEVRAEEDRLLAEQLAGWREKYPDVEVEQVVDTGHPVERLVVHCARSAGQAPAGLLVVGSRGRGGFAGLLLGSTSASVIMRAPCPVAVVRDRTHVER